MQPTVNQCVCIVRERRLCRLYADSLDVNQREKRVENSYFSQKTHKDIFR